MFELSSCESGLNQNAFSENSQEEKETSSSSYQTMLNLGKICYSNYLFALFEISLVSANKYVFVNN